MTKKTHNVIADGRRVFEIEIEALTAVMNSLDANFERAVAAVLECKGKVIVTGLGKSGAVGRKIAATLASTGTPSVFLHATEGVHGDLGVIAQNDLVIAISYSGETGELSLLIPAIKRMKVPLIAITGKTDSTLARAAEIPLVTPIDKEACPLGLAPTSSTTATLAMGDALAVAVLEARGFTAEDFAERHPGGSLGRSLLRISELMHSGADLPVRSESATISDVIIEMTEKKLGMTCVVNADGKLSGVITDGDLRRLMQKRIENSLGMTAAEVMTRKPLTMRPDEFAVKALTVMEERKITSIVITDDAAVPIGVLHIHDILRSKVV